MKLRAVSPLVIESSPDGLFASSPRASRRIRVSKPVVELLLSAKEGIDIEIPEAPASGGDHKDSAVRLLISLGYLVDADSGDMALPPPWQQWGVLAWAFHERVRDAPFIRRGSDAEAAWRETIEHDEPSPPTRLQQAQREKEAILLPRIRADLDVSFRKVLENRRTHRRFQDIPVDLIAFATLLHYTLAPMRFADARELGVRELRAYASAGARHETLGCIAVFNVADIDEGLYVYDGIRHGLVLLKKDVSREILEDLTGPQGFYTTAAFGIITVCDATRMSWKYRGPRAYRHLMNNVGTFAQVFSMTAAALGLGGAITGAIQDSAFDRLLGLEAPREFPTFSMSCGVPLLKSDGMPADFLSPRSSFSI